MKTEGFPELVGTLRGMVSKAKNLFKKVNVGFTANYAVYVHENLTAYHPVGEAKFLENASRALRPQLVQMIADGLRKGANMATVLLLAGLKLQREAQERCPVDTGALRASAFTRVED